MLDSVLDVLAQGPTALTSTSAPGSGPAWSACNASCRCRHLSTAEKAEPAAAAALHGDEAERECPPESVPLVPGRLDALPGE